MFELFLTLSLLVAVPAPQSADDAAPAEPAAAPLRAYAVLHRGNDALRTALVHEGEVWHDAGEFLVGAFAADTVRALAGRGVAAVEIGAAGAREELWVVSEAALAAAGGVLVPPGAEILRAGGVRLLALPAGSVPVPGAGHFGISRVVRRAWQPGRPFGWRGQSEAGRALVTAGADPRIQAIVDQVDQANLSASVGALSAIFTRRADRPEADTARDLIRGWFTSFGLTTRLENIGAAYAENVIAEIPGTTAPGEIVVIGGHYDSINYAGSGSAAPGADDNATGTAGVVEAARVLSTGGPYERTIRFIAFGAEEFGLIGSGVSATNSRNLGEDIVAMLNTDMSAYRASGDTRDCDFVTDDSSGALISFCAAAGALYVPGWASKSGSLSGGTSDHASYNAQGFPAVFFFEDVSQYSPYIHSASDTTTLSTNDWDLSEMIVKGLVAAAAVKAEPVDLQITHTPLSDTTDAWNPHPVAAEVVSLSGSTVTSVDLSYSDDGVIFTTVPMAYAGGDDYAAAIPSFGSPVTIHYYVTATDDQGGSETVPEGADLGGPAYTFFVGIETVFYSTGFEGPGDQGWTHGMFATQDDWQRGVPQGLAGDPAAAYEGTSVWANDLGNSGWNGEYAANTWNWLKSPAIDCSAATSVLLRLQRWLTVEEGQYDQAEIRVDGTLVWTNPTNGHLIDTAWTPFTLDISSPAAGDPSVTIEFRLRSDGGLQYGGWNVDDLALVQQEASAGNMFLYGSGVNPAGSMSILGGSASIGDTAIVGVHNPLGTQGAGSLTFLFVSTAPDSAYPAGTLLPGFGMAGAGAQGELLISIAPPDPSLYLTGVPWTGSPVPIAVAIPPDPIFVGFQAYGQGLLLDPVAAGGVKFGLTEGVVFQIGG
ncbi:MAG: M28 family peptidase [Planctomycetota bacterium]